MISKKLGDFWSQQFAFLTVAQAVLTRGSVSGNTWLDLNLNSVNFQVWKKQTNKSRMFNSFLFPTLTNLTVVSSFFTFQC